MNLVLSKSRTLAWMIWIIASIFYAYQYVLRVMPSIMLNDIMQRFQIDAAVFGQFSGIYYIGYSLMHLPIGILLDRFGPRKVMAISILLTVVGLAPLLFSTSWIYLIGGRLLIGVGSSAAILGVFKIVRMVFAEEHFSRMLSFSVMIGLLGAIYGGGPVSYMCTSFGYQTVVAIFSFAGVVLAAVTYWMIPNREERSETRILSDVKEVFSNSRVILSCIFAGLMVGPLEGFADVWGTVFLKQIGGIEKTVAASLPSMIFVGMCFGAPLLSLVAEKTKNYLLTIAGSGLAMIVGFLFLLTFPSSVSLITLNFIMIGICSAYQILAIYKASTYVRDQLAGMTTAVANMIIMIFGYAFHTVIGSVVKALGGLNVPYALLSGVIVIPVALLIGAGGFALLFFQEKKRTVNEIEF